MAKKIISKSKKESSDLRGQYQGTYVQGQRQSSCPPVNRNTNNGYHPTFIQNNRQNVFPVARTFNGSENDLSLNYNTMSGRSMYGPNVRYQPDGRTSPEVQMYKTRVIYHSRQDCAVADHEASV